MDGVVGECIPLLFLSSSVNGFNKLLIYLDFLGKTVRHEVVLVIDPLAPKCLELMLVLESPNFSLELQVEVAVCLDEGREFCLTVESVLLDLTVSKVLFVILVLLVV